MTASIVDLRLERLRRQRQERDRRIAAAAGQPTPAWLIPGAIVRTDDGREGIVTGWQHVPTDLGVVLIVHALIGGTLRAACLDRFYPAS